MNQRAGGWPLTVALDPHTLLPFFVGTYFPKEPRFGMPPFIEVLEQLSTFYQKEKQQLHKQQEQIREVLTLINADTPISQATLSSQPLVVAAQQLKQIYDKTNGGFGDHPKFPQPSNLERLLHYSFYSPPEKESCQDMLFTTLDKMALGGIYDHLGGGFYRYSVDAHWNIPHFEKMLYDNGQLLSIYSDAENIAHSSLYLHVINQTAEWVIKEMQASNGGYYSTIDADSGHEEGKFYIWNKQEVAKLLTNEEYAIFSKTFGLTDRANFEAHWHLYVADDNDYPAAENSLLASACKKLFKQRQQRIRPGRDEKIITSWNGLMIKGMAKSAIATQNSKYLDSANKAAKFIQQNLWENGRLFATFQGNAPRFMGYIDDYAYLLDGILTLLEAQWSSPQLKFAIEIAETMINNFWDDVNGGFFFTAHDHESLIYRPKPVTDDALPAGNGVAACALFRLGYLLSETRYLDIAEKTLRAAEPSINHLPYLHNTLLNALEDYLQPPKVIIIRGEIQELSAWQQICWKSFTPQLHVYAIPNNASDLPSGLSEKKYQTKTIAYICQGTQCLPPIEDITQLRKGFT